jgi:hypothetical protein
MILIKFKILLNKNLVAFYIIVSIFFIGCKKFDYDMHPHFVFDEDSLEMAKILKKLKSSDFKILGSYTLKDKPIFSLIHFENKYDINVLKINNVSKDCKYIFLDSEGFWMPNHSSILHESINFTFGYDVNIGFSKKAVTDVKFCISGKLIKNKYCDTIKDFTVHSDNFHIILNNNEDLGMFGEIESEQLKIMFYEKDKSLFIIFLTSEKGEELDKKSLTEILF